MGKVRTITHRSFPKQGSYLNKRVKVFFHDDSFHQLEGTVVRNDADEPFLLIFKLDNGQYVLSTECQYVPPL